jgi:acylphosphatase
LKGVLVFRASMKRAHARLVAPGVREIKHLRKHVVEESKRVNAPGTVLGWIRNDKDGSVEMLAEATDEEVLQDLLAFAVSEAERWLGVRVTVERIESVAGGANSGKLKAFDVGHSGSPV